MGTLRVITSLKPRLAVISEFGEELKTFRPRLMDLLAEITRKHSEQNKLPRTNVVPGDLPFVYDITNRQVYCTLKEEFVPAKNIDYKEVRLKDEDETFTYFEKDQKNSASLLKLRKATEKFMRSCKDRKVSFFQQE